MTAQIGDQFHYKGNHYNIVAISEPLPFTPQTFGITPEGACTACWAGYWCEYEIREDALILQNLYIHSKDNYYPSINGVFRAIDPKHPKEYRQIMSHYVYEHLNLTYAYTGKILIGKDSIRTHYIHMGFQRPWAYKVLLELTFADGKLVKTVDHSTIAEIMRADIQNNPEEFDKKLHNENFIAESFSLEYPIKAWWIDSIDDLD